MYLGDYALNSVLDHKWNAQAADGSSITRATNGNVRIYKNNAAAERTSIAGITDTEDFDGLVGVNHLRIDLGDNTDPGFYTAGGEYQIVLQGATIDGKAVNAVLAHFSIERAGGVLALLKSASGLTAIKADTALLKTDSSTIKADTGAIRAVTDEIGVSGYDVNVVSWNGVSVPPPDPSGVPLMSLTPAALTAVNAEVVDALAVDVYAESAAVPPASASLATKIRWLATLARNKILQTASLQMVRNDTDTGAIASTSVNDDGTTFTRGKWS